MHLHQWELLHVYYSEYEFRCIKCGTVDWFNVLNPPSPLWNPVKQLKPVIEPEPEPSVVPEPENVGIPGLSDTSPTNLYKTVEELQELIDKFAEELRKQLITTTAKQEPRPVALFRMLLTCGLATYRKGRRLYVRRGSVDRS